MLIDQIVPTKKRTEHLPLRGIIIEVPFHSSMVVATIEDGVMISLMQTEIGAPGEVVTRIMKGTSVDGDQVSLMEKDRTDAGVMTSMTGQEIGCDL